MPDSILIPPQMQKWDIPPQIIRKSIVCQSASPPACRLRGSEYDKETIHFIPSPELDVCIETKYNIDIKVNAGR
jgi:hypothetical protein